MIVADAVLTLPIQFREVIILYYFEELTIREIAMIIDSSESTIKYRLKTAKERLKKKLATQQWEVLKSE